jgi:hypothetical protein
MTPLSTARWYIGVRESERALAMHVVAGTQVEGPELAAAMMGRGDTLVYECRRNVDLAELAQVAASGGSLVQHLGDDCVRMFVSEGLT